MARVLGHKRCEHERDVLRDVGGWEDRFEVDHPDVPGRRLEVDHPDVSGRSEAWIRRELVNAHRASAERIQTTHLDKILTMCRPNAT